MRHFFPTRRSLCDMTAGQRVWLVNAMQTVEVCVSCVLPLLAYVTLSQAMMLAIVILGNVLPLVSWSGEEQ